MPSPQLCPTPNAGSSRGSRTSPILQCSRLTDHRQAEDTPHQGPRQIALRRRADLRPVASVSAGSLSARDAGSTSATVSSASGAQDRSRGAWSCPPVHGNVRRIAWLPSGCKPRGARISWSGLPGLAAALPWVGRSPTRLVGDQATWRCRREAGAGCAYFCHRASRLLVMRAIMAGMTWL